VDKHAKVFILNHLNLVIPPTLQDLLSSRKKIVVTSHHNPDGDAIGSTLAMLHYLKLMGHQVSAMVPNAFPDFLSWMPGASDILICETEKKQCEELILNAQIIFCLDYNAFQRTSSLQGALNTATGLKVMIDHHPEPKKEDFDFLFSKVETSSTGELIYEFIKAMDGTPLINLEVATGIFVGIMTDTGSFSYSCNHESTYRIVAELLKYGLDAGNIHRLVYDTFSESRLRLLGYCLSEKLVVLPEYATAYITLSKEDLRNFNYQVGDTEGVVNYALSIKGIVLAAFMTERDDRVRLSFRSKGDFSVNDLARKYFAGGGHKNAAGGDSYVSLDKTIQAFESLLPEYKEALIKNA
jgi:phosphoesterase RecJ-like protein